MAIRGGRSPTSIRSSQIQDLEFQPTGWFSMARLSAPRGISTGPDGASRKRFVLTTPFTTRNLRSKRWPQEKPATYKRSKAIWGSIVKIGAHGAAFGVLRAYALE